MTESLDETEGDFSKMVNSRSPITNISVHDDTREAYIARDLMYVLALSLCVKRIEGEANKTVVNQLT
jgi:hypothetical protein